MTEVRVLVGTDDFERSAAFYSEVLGFPVDEHWDDPDGRGTLFRVTSGGVIEIAEDSPHHPAEPAGGITVAIELDDVDGMYDRVTAAGVDVVTALDDRPWGIETSRSETRVGSVSCSSLESEREQQRDG